MASSYYRSFERQERARAKQLARDQKEREKRSALEAAKASVEEYEAAIAELKSLHKQSSERIDWIALASVLPPAPPALVHSAAQMRQLANSLLVPLGETPADAGSAAAADAANLSSLAAAYTEKQNEHRATSQMAFRVLAEDIEAYLQVLRGSPSLAELTERGGRLDFVVRSPRLVECSFFPLASSVVPAEIRSLTSTGKLTSKAMPRAQSLDLYQDFVCSGVLRIAREVHDLLPIDAALITVFSGDEGAEPEPIISVVIHRSGLERLDFERLDPSDAVETFMCKSNFKATRKSAAFQPIAPLSTDDASILLGTAAAVDLMKAARVLLDQLE